MYANKLDQCSPGQFRQPRSPDVVYGSQDGMGDHLVISKKLLMNKQNCICKSLH